MLIGPWSHIGLLDNRVGHARSGMFSAFALHSYALDFARRCCAAQPGSDAAVEPGGPPTGQLEEAEREANPEAHAAGAAAASGNQLPDGRAAPKPGVGAGSGPRGPGDTSAASGAAAGSTAAAAGEPTRPTQECNGSAHTADLPGAPDGEPAAEPGAERGPAAMELPSDRMPVHYYLMGWRPRWEAAPCWPPPEGAAEPMRLYLTECATEPEPAPPAAAGVRAVPGGRPAAVRRARNPFGITFPQPEFLQAAGGAARPLQLSANPGGAASPADTAPSQNHHSEGRSAAVWSAGPAESGAVGVGAVSSGETRSAPDSAGAAGASAAGAADLEAGVSPASEGVRTVRDPSAGVHGRRTGSTAQVRHEGPL